MEPRIFQILDVSYEIVGNRPRILLWARMDNGERALIFYEGFKPYFYAVTNDELSEDYEKQIKALSKPRSPITSIQRVERRFFGRKVTALKIETLLPDHVRTYRSEVAKLGFVERVLEADIRYTMRFLIDNNLYPLRWYEASLEKTEASGYRVDAVYKALSKPREYHEWSSKDPLEGLRVIGFDIEVYSKEGSPNPEKDPVIIISLADNMGRSEALVQGEYSEAGLLQAFVRRIIDFDPDVIVGYNQDHFDWLYLKERASRLGVKLDVGRREGSTPETSVYGHVSVPGRLNVDLYNFAEEVPGPTLKTLEEIADFLGVKKKEERVLIPWYKIPSYWEDPGKRGTLVKYALDDVVSTIGLAEKFLPFGAQLSITTGIPLDHVMAASTGFRLEWRLIREAYKRGELVPERVERPPSTYTGALVLKPLPGIHENVAVLDFASMYPSIMVKYNVGPDTIIRQGETYEPREVFEAPQVGHKFRVKPDGFFKLTLRRFLEWRRQIKEKLKNVALGSPEYLLLDQRQRAIKVLANAVYGYMGWSGARWYCRECAEAVTAWGREFILSAIDKARKLGLRVYYGDTDSLFVDYDPGKVDLLIKEIEEDLGLEIKIDKIYRRILFTGAKKRYAGLTMDGHLDVTGLEAVRGDWCELAKEVQIRVLEIVLRENNVDKAIDYVRRVVESLRKRVLDLEKLVIWKTLTRRPSDYKVDGAHVRAALMLEKAGYHVVPGMKIGYVVIRGRGKLSERVKPYILASKDEVDVEYYIDKQIIPAAMRVLQPLGVTENKLKRSAAGQRSLLDFI